MISAIRRWWWKRRPSHMRPTPEHRCGIPGFVRYVNHCPGCSPLGEPTVFRGGRSDLLDMLRGLDQAIGYGWQEAIEPQGNYRAALRKAILLLESD